MQLSIFWRLTVGYLVILFLSVAVSSYSILQLERLSNTARATLRVDNRMIAYGEKLTDSFLSEVRYAGRFIITQSSALHDQFRQFKTDFSRYMAESKSLAPSPDIETRLSRIEDLHDRYQELFDREIGYLKARQPYSESRYQQEREKVLESSLRELERLKGHLQKNLNEKLGTMEKSARRAQTIATLSTAILLGLGLVLSFVISRSITTPLAELRRLAVPQSAQDRDSASTFARIPEIRQLAESLHEARQRIHQSARTNAAFVDMINEQLTTPLVSLKTRLTYFDENLTKMVSPEQRTALGIAIAETENLIQRCIALRPQLPQETNPQDEKQLSVGRDSDETILPQPNLRAMSRWNESRIGLEASLKTIRARWASFLSGCCDTVSHLIRLLGYRKVQKP